MSLKSSTKVDVNTQELLFEVDAEGFEAAVNAAYEKQKRKGKQKAR